MAYLLVKGQRFMMDMTEMQLEYLQNDPIRKKIYSFLSLTWALISDIDLNSEHLRCCGDTRFTVWGLYRVAN